MPSTTTSPGGGERFFLVFILLLSSGAFLNLLPSSGGDNRLVASSAGMQALWASLYLGVFVLLLRHCKGFIRRLASDPWLLMLLALAFISTAWSSDPSLTFKKSIGLLGTYLAAVYLVMRYDLKTQIELIAWALGSTALLSVPFGMLSIGDCGYEIGGPAGWCGVYPHKNALGAMMVLATVVFIVMARMDFRRRWTMRIFAGLSIGLILLSDSKTSLVTLLGIMLMLPYSKLLRGSISRAVMALSCAGIAGILGLYLALHHLSDLTNLLGRDSTFSGRLQLWVLSFVMALQKPWLGYGYGAFWQGKQGPSAPVMHALGTWQAFYAHNGLLELWLDLGLISVAIFVLGFVVCIIRAIRFLRNHRGPECIWPLAILIFMFFTNLTESSVLSPDNISWVLYVAAALLISPAFRRPSVVMNGSMLEVAPAS
jgi:exopolysaccharide production protein ExoQ